MEHRIRVKATQKHSQRHEKTKAKATDQKHRSGDSYIFEEEHTPTLEETVNKNLNKLHSLGKQKFGLSPFSQHFNRWLWNLQDILSELDSNPNMKIDEKFEKERSQILANVEIKLEERRRNEASEEKTIKSLSDMKLLLEQIEEEYTTRTKETEKQKNRELNRLSRNIDDIREELDHIARMKTGIFRSILKNTKEQKESEATQRLNSAERELTLAIQNFTSEQEKIRKECEIKKQPVIERIDNQQKEIQSQEIDGSLEDRRGACEALVNAVNALLQRNLQIKNI
jgi:hypothetical protein